MLFSISKAGSTVINKPASLSFNVSHHAPTKAWDDDMEWEDDVVEEEAVEVEVSLEEGILILGNSESEGVGEPPYVLRNEPVLLTIQFDGFGGTYEAAFRAAPCCSDWWQVTFSILGADTPTWGSVLLCSQGNGLADGRDQFRKYITVHSSYNLRENSFCYLATHEGLAEDVNNNIEDVVDVLTSSVNGYILLDELVAAEAQELRWVS